MTRINTVPPSILTDQHLLGEYNEVRRPVNLAIKFYEKHGEKGLEHIPPSYRLRSGHVKFFYDKLQYIHRRFDMICDEMRNRGFQVNTGFDRDRVPDRLYNDWEPNDEAIEILKGRLRERLISETNLRYYRQHIDTLMYLNSILES